MIRKLRLQFVAACMTLVTLVLALVFFAAYGATRQNTEALSHEVLEEVLRQDQGLGLLRPELGIDVGGDRLLLPYFTVNLWPTPGGEYSARVTGGTYDHLEDNKTLAEILQQTLKQGKQEGVLPHYQLRYLRQDNGLYEKLAFVDMSMERAILGRLMGSYLRIGALAFLLLLGISILLARKVTRPVERAWRQQKQFLSDASHELKTPLTVILSNADLLGQSALEPRPARWAENIRQEAREMRELVEQMLVLARSDHGVRTAVLSELSLTELATNCALAFEPVAFEAGKPLETSIQEEVFVLGDREKLRQLLGVLLDNAIKYGAKGGSIKLRLEKTERQARLTVENPGEPIPPEQLRRLFERFYRLDQSRGEQQGFGLGLPIAAAIAGEHKGSLKAESDAASTRFLLTLPLKK